MSTPTHCTAEERTALYRFYDDRETLLYVGITSDPWRRWREHVQDKRWYPQVKHQAVTWYESRPEAERAESRAIRAERPEFNIAGAIRPPEARNFPMGTARAVGIVWLTLPGMLAATMLLCPSMVPLFGWLDLVLICSLPIPIIAKVLASYAPEVYRFGCWLNRNFTGLDEERSV